MSLRPGRTGFPKGFSALAIALLMLAGGAQSALAGALVPTGFFDQETPAPAKGPANVEADSLVFDSRASLITATGGVILDYQGYLVKGDRLVYNQKTGEMHVEGNAYMKDPLGNVYTMDSMDITAGFKEAVLASMTLTLPNGATITASDAHYVEAMQNILTDAVYSPCGLCIDEKGRPIGWKIRSARIIFDKANASITLEQPRLELLGLPVAWVPWLWLPDPSQPRAQGVRIPTIISDEERGIGLTVPYFVPYGDDTDIILSPTLMSRQGAMLGVEVDHRFPGFGEVSVSATGVYQLDPMAYSFADAQRDWRGAIQTSGTFTPTPEWTVGWSYTAFSDHAYLPDYDLSDDDSTVNQLYATYLTPDIFGDIRVQRFNRLGDYTDADDDRQGLTLPWARFAEVFDLGPDAGQISLNADLLGIHREADQDRTSNGVTAVTGYAEDKAHLMVEGAWQKQWIFGNGITATPYLGGRLDGTVYDGAGTYGGPGAAAPGDNSLLSLTPIAAMDVRWPLISTNGVDTALLEPIAQLVYRASDTTKVGITNDNAQSFVFDDTNLFSYNRFSGTDRQETGLRANIGGHYLVTMADGTWVDLLAGQSFHLAGTNALGVSDGANTGIATGLEDTASYMVAGAKFGLPIGLQGGGKIMVDPNLWTVRRAGLGLNYSNKEFTAGLDYIYLAATPTIGQIKDNHEVVGTVGVPVSDYWTLNGSLSLDLEAQTWTEVTAGATYNDGYLTYGLTATIDPTSWSVAATFNLLGPTGESAF